MKKQKSLLVLILAVTMTFSSAACTGDISTAGGTVTVPGNGMWVDSSIRGEIIGESAPRLQDDFAATYYIIQKNRCCLYHAIVTENTEVSF